MPAPIETWDYPADAFDLVVSRLVLHYVDDFAAVCAHVYRTLAGNGRFVFSVEHPVITSCDRGWQPGTLRQDWIVDDYFGALQRTGFIVESLRESRPDRALFTDSASTSEGVSRISLYSGCA